MFVYQKIMFERNFCIKSFENFGKTLGKVHFCITTCIMARKSMKDS